MPSLAGFAEGAWHIEDHKRRSIKQEFPALVFVVGERMVEKRV